jgi:fibronectin-binding autotransporter adhesin
MKHSNILTRSIACLLACTLASPAASLTWDGNGNVAPNPWDGAANWETTTLRFWNGAAHVAWNNANNDTAVFGTGGGMFSGIPGAATLTVPITVGGLQFNDYTGNNVKYNITGNTLTLAGAAPTIQMNTSITRPYALINSIVAGTSGFTLAGNAHSILEFGTQANTITGGFRLSSGTLAVANDVALGGAGNGITFTGNAGLLFRATTGVAAGRTITINAGATGAIDSLAGVTTTLAGQVTGAGNLEKSGLGNLVLQGANTYAGETRVRQGNLTLDFNAATAPAVNMIATTSALRLAGGGLILSGKADQATTQAFAGTTFAAGASSMQLTANGAGSVNLNLGTIARLSGASLNLAPIGAATSYTTSSTFTNALGWATVNNADFVTQSGANLVALTAYNTSNDPASWLASDNVSLATNPLTPISTSVINTLKTTAGSAIAIADGNTLTIAGGGILATGAGAVNLNGGTIVAGGGSDLVIHQHNTANPMTINSIVANNAGGAGLVKAGSGALVLGGENTYSGNTFVNAGALTVSADANLGTGNTVTLRAGTTLVINGAAPFASAKNFQFDLGSNTYGGAALGAAQGSLGNFNVNVANTAGATISGAFNVSAGTFVKTGAGALTLTNNGINRLGSINGGLAFTVENGSLTFDGGAGSEWSLAQGEFNIGIGDNATAAATRSATVTLNSGTVRTGSWTALGRGSGNIGNTYTLNVNGGSWNSGNLFTGFANGVGGYNATSIVNVTGSGVINVGDTLRLAESAGGTTQFNVSNSGVVNVNGSVGVGWGATGTLNLSDSASMTVGVGTISGAMQVGNGAGARGLVKIGAGASLNTAATAVGAAANSSGAIWNRGTYVNRGVAAIGNFPLGNGAGAYGYYLHDSTVPSVFQEVGVGGAGGGSGVFEVRSGTVTTAQWMTINRTDAVQATSAQVLLSGGTLVPNNLAGRFYANQIATAALTSYINVGAGGRIQGGPATDINLNNTANAGHQTVLSVYGGGVVEAGRIFAAQGTGSAVVSLDGGTLKATAAANLLDNNLDAVLVQAGGATFDTNGLNVNTGATPLTAPTGTGIQDIPVMGGGAGYIGRPVVKITDPTGFGASAVANFDETTGQILGITITSAGSNYTAPTVTLVGGGATSLATVGSVTLAPVANTGGVTKTGAGTLTIPSSGTYGGLTRVNNGTLIVTGANNAGGGVLVAAGGVLSFGNNTATGMIAGAAEVNGSLNFERTDDLSYDATVTGSGVINKNRANTLTLPGNLAGFAGAVNVNAGTLVSSGTVGGSVNVNAGALVASGTVAGAVNVNSTARLVPFAGATGTVTVGSLALNNGSAVDFEFGAGGAPFDQIVVGPGGTLTFGTAFTLNLYEAGSVNPFSTNGTYPIFDYTTAIAGTPGAFTVGNPVSGKGYALRNNTTNTTVELSVFDVVVSAWTSASGGLWSSATNWSNGVPNGISSEATLGGAITAASTIDLDGPKTVGKVTFDNANGYTITGAGPLILDNDAASASLTVTTGSHVIESAVSMVGSLTASTAANTTLRVGNLSGPGALTKAGPGRLILAGNSAYAGGTTVTAGTLQVGNGGTTGSLPAGAVPLGAEATLAISRSDDVTLPNALSGGGSLAQIGAGATTYTGSATYTGGTTVTAGSLINQGTINGTSGVSVLGGILSNGGTLNANGPINIAAGAGTTGTLAVSGGTITQSGDVGLAIGVDGGTGSYIQTGGTVNLGTANPGFRLGAGTNGSNGTASISDGILNVAQEFWISNDSSTNTATMTMSGGAVNVGNWFVVGRLTGVGTLNLSGGTITKTGAGFIILGSLGGSGTVTQTGGQFNATTNGIRLGENTGTIPAVGTLWDMQGGSSTVNGEINVAWRSSEATWNIKPGATVSATGRLVVAAETNNATINIGPIVNGAPVGTVNMTGGTASFTGADSRIGGDNATSQTASGTVNVTGGTMNFGGNVQIGAYGRGSMLVAGTGIVNSTGGFPVIGRFAGSVGELTVDAGGTFNQTVPTNGLIVGEDGKGTLNIFSGGVVNVENLYMGHTATGDGTVNLTGGLLSTRVVQRTNTATSVATFNFDGGTLRAKATSADFFPGFTNSQLKVEAGGAVVDTNGFTVTIGQDLTPGLSAGGGLTKKGAGTLRLGGASTYAGVTIVESGRLEVTGSVTGRAEVETGATLAGTGSILADVLVKDGGTLAPGLTTGTLNVTGLSMELGSALAIEINGTGSANYDSLNVTGEISLAGSLQLSGSYLAPQPAANDLFFILLNDGIDFVFGEFDGLADGSAFKAPNGQDFRISYFGDSAAGTFTGGNDIVLQAVPEPGSAVLLMGGIALLASGRRRRS